MPRPATGDRLRCPSLFRAPAWGAAMGTPTVKGTGGTGMGTATVGDGLALSRSLMPGSAVASLFRATADTGMGTPTVGDGLAPSRDRRQAPLPVAVSGTGMGRRHGDTHREGHRGHRNGDSHRRTLHLLESVFLEVGDARERRREAHAAGGGQRFSRCFRTVPPDPQAARGDGRAPRIALRSLALPARRCGARAVQPVAACGSNNVRSRSMAQATLSRRSATERRARAWPWPRPRRAS